MPKLPQVLLLLLVLAGPVPAAAADEVPLPPALESIAGVVESEIALGNLPGAMVIVGDAEGIRYRQAFGRRALVPAAEAMTADTIFDLASLTKVVVTTTAVLQLAEAGKLELDAPAARYWPAFGAHGKGAITIRQLLAHTAGLRPDLDVRKPWHGHAKALQLIVAERPETAPGTRVRYSDINFEVLGELVARVSGEALEDYAQRHILKPLQMRDSGFRPVRAELGRVAPTEIRPKDPQRGLVHDSTAFRMGGVAGHAGLFGTADDLARFATMLLNGGSLDGARLLKPETVDALVRPVSPLEGDDWRSFGWKLAAPFTANRDQLPPLGAIGHTGYTGTAMWIDFVTRRYLIVLSNRVHPHGGGDAGPIRQRLLARIASETDAQSTAAIATRLPGLAPYLAKAPLPGDAGKPVLTGVDLFGKAKFAALKGLRVGLITNHTGRDAAGRRTLELLLNTDGVTLAAIFSPEHGINGDRDEKVASGTLDGGRLPLYSLYGKSLRPGAETLQALDALVFDIQDAGARFYTYISTMAYAMEAAAKRGIPFYVLDRPNPIGAHRVEGPLLDADLRSFTGYFRMPIQHGMTVGELAQLFNQENRIGADLRVIPMRGYRRDRWYDQTGLPWIAPSPNLRTLTAAILYPGVAQVEGANVSVGRGTDSPFELVGAPWINAAELAAYLAGRQLAGVRFTPAEFRPTDSNYRGQTCQGVRIELLDRNALNAPQLGIELTSALYRLYPGRFQIDRTLGMIGDRAVLQAIREGVDPSRIAQMWESGVAAFRAMRGRYLLY